GRGLVELAGGAAAAAPAAGEPDADGEPDAAGVPEAAVGVGVLVAAGVAGGVSACAGAAEPLPLIARDSTRGRRASPDRRCLALGRKSLFLHYGRRPRCVAAPPRQPNINHFCPISKIRPARFPRGR